MQLAVPREILCDAYVITGSKASVYDDLDWIPPLVGFLSEVLQAGKKVIALVPRCALMMKFEWPLIVPDDPDVQALAEPVLATARYDDTATLIIAPDSVDRGEVDRLRSLLVSSNTDFAGILWLTPSFDLADETLRTALKYSTGRRSFSSKNSFA